MALQSFVNFPYTLTQNWEYFHGKFKNFFLLNSPGFDIREENDANELKMKY